MGAARTELPSINDAARAACILAVDGAAIGGLSLRSRAGPARDQLVALVRELLPPEAPCRRLPANIGDERLLGGLDLAATLRAKTPVMQRGLLAESCGGLIIAPMAERLPPALAARLASVIDTGEVAIERDGFGERASGRIALLALDEGINDDERPPQALLDRLAIHLDFTETAGETCERAFTPAQVAAARLSLARVKAGDDITRALCEVADQLGVLSIRAPMLALKVARIHAALNGRVAANDEDTVIAARLVLVPRATKMPSAETEETEESEPQQNEDTQSGEQQDESMADDAEPQTSGPLADMVLEAVAAAIPAGLLDKVKAAGRVRAVTSGRFGAQRNTASRGRPIGALRSDMRSGLRMHLVETLRAAAPWQTLRRSQSINGGRHIDVRREDFRVIRYRHRTETATVFVVDASGSAAMHRLAEAKGAVELLLADCYIRRDQVAMISFRGSAAEILLPPTRSLARAKRTLADMPGGGGTPLAAAVDAGLMLADALRRKGISPTLVFLTDGRANVGRGVTSGRAGAEADAYVAARLCRASKLATVVVDTSPRPGPAAAQFASEMGGRYLPLPFADASSISSALRCVTPALQARATH